MLLCSIQGIIKSLLVTCLSWAHSVTKDGRLLHQRPSLIWSDCFCLHGLITTFWKSQRSSNCSPWFFVFFSLLLILFSCFYSLNAWMAKAERMPEACGPPTGNEQVTEATASSSKLFGCSCVHRWLPLAYREELYHVLRLTGPLVSSLTISTLSYASPTAYCKNMNFARDRYLLFVVKLWLL